MFDENDSNFDASTDDLLSWKPPKPTINIDDIVEIEKFLFGEQMSLNMDPDEVTVAVKFSFNGPCFFEKAKEIVY